MKSMEEVMKGEYKLVVLEKKIHYRKNSVLIEPFGTFHQPEFQYTGENGSKCMK